MKKIGNNDKSQKKPTYNYVDNQLQKASIVAIEHTNNIRKYILTDIVSKTKTPIFTDSHLELLKGLSNSINNQLNMNMKNMIASLEMGLDFSKTLESIKKIFANLDFSDISKLSGKDSKILNKYYWVIPFEYKYEKVKDLEKLKSRVNFDKKMLVYFNRNRTKRLFSKVKKKCFDDDKKELIKQVEESYFNGNYAVCIVSLTMLYDGLTLQLLDSNSKNTQASYKVITDLLKYIEKSPLSKFGYELYIKVDILNNFNDKLFRFEPLKTTKSNQLSRHMIAHGIKYLNRKIDALRILNAVYFCQEVIDESKLQEQFTKESNDRNFKIILKQTKDNTKK